MIRIGVQQDIDQVVGRLAEQFPRQVEIAQQRAVLGTARIVKDEVVKEMQRAFDRPTRWTLNAFRVSLSSADRLVAQYNDKAAPWKQTGMRAMATAGSEITARVVVKDTNEYRADNYLQTQIEGGTRRRKAIENALQTVGVLPSGWFVVPGRSAKIDAFGNHSPGELRQILAWFDAAELGKESQRNVTGFRANMRDAGRDKRRKGTRKKYGFEYFAVQPNARRGGLRPGIYRRTFMGLGGRIEPIMIFVRSTAYGKRFKFNEVASQTVRREFKPRLERALADELAKVQA